MYICVKANTKEPLHKCKTRLWKILSTDTQYILIATLQNFCHRWKKPQFETLLIVNLFRILSGQKRNRKHSPICCSVGRGKAYGSYKILWKFHMNLHDISSLLHLIMQISIHTIFVGFCQFLLLFRNRNLFEMAEKCH